MTDDSICVQVTNLPGRLGTVLVRRCKPQGVEYLAILRRGCGRLFHVECFDSAKGTVARCGGKCKTKRDTGMAKP
jgi:hypothetical protein